ncbi:MAG: hypothetical protein WC785_07430 [Tatlockia sp.]|jgi:hypothetical protein
MQSGYDVTVESAFSTILSMAETENYAGLSHWLEETGHSVSLWKGMTTPILQLAKEGKERAVNFLIEQFEGDILQAIEGYARKGWVLQVNRLLPFANPNFAARGFAQSGNEEALEKLASGAGTKIRYLLEGAARGGQIDTIKRLLALPSLQYHKTALLSIALAGLLAEGHDEAIDTLDWSELTPLALANTKLKVYAQLGHVVRVNPLLEQGASPQLAVEYYAKGGHKQEVKNLLALYPDNTKLTLAATKGFALGGHFSEVVTDNFNTSCIVTQCHAFSGHFKQVNRLYTTQISLAAICRKYLEGGYCHPNHLQRLLYLTENKALQAWLIEESAAIYPEIDPEKLSNTLLQMESFKAQGVGFEEAMRYLKTNRRVRENAKQDGRGITGAEYWLLLGQTKVCRHYNKSPFPLQEPWPLPPEITAHITTFLTGTSLSRTQSYIERTKERIKSKKNASFLKRTFQGIEIAPTFCSQFGYIFGTVPTINPLEHNPYTDFNVTLYSFLCSLPMEQGLHAGILKCIQQACTQKNTLAFRNKKTALTLLLPKRHAEEDKDAILYTLDSNTTWPGFKALLDCQLINAENPTHFIHLKGVGAQFTRAYSLFPNKDKKGITLAHCDGFATLEAPYEPEAHDLLLQKTLASLSFQTNLHFVEPTHPVSSTGKIARFIQQEIDTLCAHYNFKMKEAKTSDEKIGLIAEYTQLIYQLHPFKDTRPSLFYLLLNRLLHEEKMPFALFDCTCLLAFSQNELKRIIKQGQINYLGLLQGQPVSFANGFTCLNPEITSNKISLSQEECISLLHALSQNINRLDEEYLIRLTFQNVPFVSESGMYANEQNEQETKRSLQKTETSYPT